MKKWLFAIAIAISGCITDAPMYHGEGADRSPSIAEFVGMAALFGTVMVLVGFLFGRERDR